MANLSQYDPDGVAPPMFVASAVMADLKREKAKTFHPERQPIELPASEAAHRADLFARARRGQARAIRQLAEEYHLRIIPVGAVSN